MTVLPPKAEAFDGAGISRLLTASRHSTGSSTNGRVRPQTVIDWDHAQRPFPDLKADDRANCGGAQQSLDRLCRLWDLKAEALGRYGFRRLMTQFRPSVQQPNC